MAQLVLKNVDPLMLQKLEQRAKRLGSTVEAVAVRLLEDQCQHLAALHPATSAEGVVDADFEAAEQDTDTAREGSSVPPGSSSGATDAGARALRDRQAVLADAYPEEYVVLLDERVLVHTTDKDEAYAYYDAAFEEAGSSEPIIVPPGALRRIGPPIIRGRSLSAAFGAGRR